MGSLKNVVRTTKDKLLQLLSGLTVNGHTFDHDNLYFVELDFSKFLLGITLNGQWAGSPSFYAPLSSGIAGLMLYSGGNGVTPYWGDAPSGGSSGSGGITGVTFTPLLTETAAYPLSVSSSLLSNKVTAIPYMLHLKYPDLSALTSGLENFIITEHNRNESKDSTEYLCHIPLSSTLPRRLVFTGSDVFLYTSLVIYSEPSTDKIGVKINLSGSRQDQHLGKYSHSYELATLTFVNNEVSTSFNASKNYTDTQISNALNGIESRLENI